MLRTNQTDILQQECRQFQAQYRAKSLALPIDYLAADEAGD